MIIRTTRLGYIQRLDKAYYIYQYSILPVCMPVRALRKKKWKNNCNPLCSACDMDESGKRTGQGIRKAREERQIVKVYGVCLPTL